MTEPWNDYWETAEASADDGVLTAAAGELTDFWSRRISEILTSGHPRTLLDMACGAAPVARQAAALADEAGQSFKTILCADFSEPAVRRIEEQAPDKAMIGLVADAAAAPLTDQSFDLVVSQFGLEYAGEGAFAEAARLVAPEGRLIVVSHLGGGPIHRECAANYQLLAKVAEADPLGRAAPLFELGAELAAGRARPADLAAGEAALVESFQAVEAAVIATPEAGGAADFLKRMIPDLATLYTRRAAYGPEQVREWIGHQREALEGYAARMEAMTKAALGEMAMDAIQVRLDEAGLTDITVEPMAIRTGDAPAAWRLEARRAA